LFLTGVIFVERNRNRPMGGQEWDEILKTALPDWNSLVLITGLVLP